MTRGRRVVGLAVAAGVLALPVPAQAALQWRVCEERQYECARLIVPLDHTGAVSGSVSLRLERTHAFRHRDQPKGVTLLLGGEPGESATSQFFGEYDNELPETLTDALPRNRVVVFDQRGTGGSGALRCRDLQAAAPTDAGREAEACATLLGARRGFYRTSDTVADIEALRAELAVARLTIVATGYGAYVAQRYALSHPDRVERLVLDTPVDAAGRDPLMGDSLVAARRVIYAGCRKRCGFTRDAIADTERLSTRIAASPLRGWVVGVDGRRRRATLTPQELLFTYAGSDRDIFGRIDFPAAVTSALRGDTAPLFRLKRRAVRGGAGDVVSEFSAATRAAVLCEEVSFPWSRHASPAERAAATDAATGLLTAELARPFGAGAAARSDLMRLCRRWPTASAAPPADPGPMPDVPVLVIAANTGIRNPLETARRTASRFARSQLIVAPAIFGTPLTGETDCVSRALERFLADRPISRRCPESRFRLTPGRPLPTSIVQLRPVPSVGGRRGQVVRAVGLTLEDLNEDVYSTALGDGFDFDRDGFRGAGLRGGRYALGDEHQVLSAYEFVPGVRLSLRSESDDDSATLRVDGPGRLDGRLRTEESDGDEDDLDYIVRGTLGGRHVRARLTFHSRLLLAIGVGE
jgi:pimeloyl-ACP methyl ester carboxylesterase